MGSGGGGGGGGNDDKPAKKKAAPKAKPKKAGPKGFTRKSTTPTKQKEKASDNKFNVNKRKVGTIKSDAKPVPKPVINEAREARIGPSKSLTKSFEATKELRKTSGDPTARVDVFKTPADFSAGVAKAKSRGPSPLDVKATFGAVGDLNADQVAANVAGRTGLNVRNMGQLATRARVGQLPAGNVMIPSVGSAALNIANIAGKKAASNIMSTIASDAPTMKDGKVTYGTKLVTDKGTGAATKFGDIQGYVKGGRYTGRGDYSPDLLAGGSVLETVRDKPQKDDSPDPAPLPKIEDKPEVVADADMGTLTTKRRRGSGRRISFGARSSLINLRSLGKN